MAFLAIVVRTKRAGAEGAPARKGGERHHRRSSGGGRGWNQGAPGERAGRQGRSPAPRPARHSHRAWLSAQPFPSSQPLYFYSLFFLIIIIIFSRAKRAPGTAQASRVGAAISRGKLSARRHRAPRKGNRRGVPGPEPSSAPARGSRPPAAPGPPRSSPRPSPPPPASPA